MLADIENTIINAIKNAPNMKYVRTVDSYGGQFDTDLFEVIRVLPAIWITFGGTRKPAQTGEKTFLTPATFAVMCCARSLRGERTTRHNGAAGEVGVYQMLEDVRQLLLMKDLGLPIDYFRPGAITTLYNTKIRESGLAVFAQEWHTKFADSVQPSSESDLLRIDLEYRLKPGNDLNDASDLVERKI